MTKSDKQAATPVVAVIAGAAQALKLRVEEVNKLNVFPVPDGDTGTNMTLTLESVVNDVSKLAAGASIEEYCKSATHGSLMGARGNSGVILSQIIRGICEGLVASDGFEATERLAASLERAKEVAWQAVRKPVEGTMLTVIADMATAARSAAEAGLDFEAAADGVSAAAHESVRRTPELLPVLKEAGVVDAGGFGLVIVYDAFMALLLGRELADLPQFEPMRGNDMVVTPVDDWDDDEFLYCTEFLFMSSGDFDVDAALDHLGTLGGSELVVGADGQYKVHVHTDDPAAVLAFHLKQGEVADVHIHNMRQQQAAQTGTGAAGANAAPAPHKNIAVIAVSSGDGLANILTSLGVDYVIKGGQTMNPSTQDFIDAAATLNADNIILLPNNKNIVMAAQAAATALPQPAYVVPTTNVPAAFSAMLMFDGAATDVEALAEEMLEGAEEVNYGEVTAAIKDSSAPAVGKIKEGDIMGIVDSKDIEVLGSSVDEVALALMPKLCAHACENLTILAGEDYSDEAMEALAAQIEKAYPDLEVDCQRGDQPLYPLLLAIE
ncbi:MAG: DAK2 domain-containing protein [Coriobacteriia bacterium]|nr:DAK2 domain-containing protein [Coriobacteriia bacterium]MCL2537149.1 DAK2 domain-containing protein [Coriobacteriia bacterium]